MQQGDGGLARHAGVAVGRAGDHAFEQAKDAAHPGNAIERGDEMHLRGARIGEAGIDAAAEQRMDQGFGAVHCGVLRSGEDSHTAQSGAARQPEAQAMSGRPSRSMTGARTGMTGCNCFK